MEVKTEIELRDELKRLTDLHFGNIALDGADEPVYLAPSLWNLTGTQERFPKLQFLETREIV